MAIVGLHLHKRASQLSGKADDGSSTDRRIAIRRERFRAVFGGRAPADQGAVAARYHGREHADGRLGRRPWGRERGGAVDNEISGHR